MNRAAPLRNACYYGKSYPSEEAALRSKRAGRDDFAEVRPCHLCPGWHVHLEAGSSPSQAGAVRRVRAETGFSRAAKLLIRTRAGNGDPAAARCEATGLFLGLHGGECQHIQARGMGGSRLLNTASNGALLSSPAHALCEARDPHMREMGFWLWRDDEPGPFMLHDSSGGGLLVWRDDLGNYLDAQGCILAFGALAGAT